MRQILLQNATAILLQHAAKVYYEIREVFVLQNATVITKCVDFIAKCDSELLQKVTFIKLKSHSHLPKKIFYLLQ